MTRHPAVFVWTRLAFAVVLALAAGCAGMGSQRDSFRLVQPQTTNRPPTQRSESAPLGAQPGVRQRAAEVHSNQSTESSAANDALSQKGLVDRDQKRESERAGNPGGRDLPDKTKPDKSVEIADDSAVLGSQPPAQKSRKLTLPDIEFNTIVPIGQVELEVSAAERGTVERLMTYHVLVRNSTSLTQSKLKLKCQLPAGLNFPGHDANELTANCPVLAAGETKEWDLSLLAETPGEKCCLFRIEGIEQSDEADSNGENSPVEQRVCVVFRRQYVLMDWIGPQSLSVGSEKEFVLEMRNSGRTTIKQASIRVTSDKALELGVGNSTSTDSEGTIWQIGELKGNATERLVISAKGLSTARRACLRAELLDGAKRIESEELCLAVNPEPTSLSLELTDRVEPLTVGKKEIYDWRLKNAGLQSVSQVDLEFEIPGELVVLRATVKRDGRVLSSDYTIDGDRLTFGIIKDLAADEELTGTIEVEAVQSGRVVLKGTAKSSDAGQSVRAEESTLLLSSQEVATDQPE